MNVITLSSLKGGVGKSSITIQLANCLGMAGKKVLVIDMDLNNSVSSYYLTDETNHISTAWANDNQEGISSPLLRESGTPLPFSPPKVERLFPPVHLYKSVVYTNP